MIKIEKVTDKQGIERTLAEVSELYWSELNKKNYNNQKKSYITNLENSVKRFCSKYEKKYNNLCEKIKDSKFIKSIICDMPDVDEWNKLSLNLSDFLRKDKTNGNITLKDEIKNIFSYTSLRDNYKITHWLGENLNIVVCPYCNVQPTHFLTKGNGVQLIIQNFQFEHFYPQKLYPQFAISFYNLIPACANCNHKKGDTDTFIHKMIHPYQDSFHQKCKFTLDINDVISYVNHRKMVKPNFQLVCTDKQYENEVKQHEETFNFSLIHQEYKDVVEEIYWKKYIYNESRKKELESITELGLTPEEINRFILGNYTEEKDLMKRPLAKLTRDIAEELGLI